MFFELPWVGVAKDAMAVARSIKYLVCQNAHFTFY